eukprot:CAMPEP_0182448062 /NCGR_PEP_ID=MMETSP1172-20130603/23148_1 /TAXON_ID=708627 /ORGANISM="Timspurckia oligopyrenoides, Strain CCMP3278" /LENGTH=754 /DNA_ID=CAMNT_0024644779 /DNA_START=48 /DNA_END=2312 /DNA_ORIENTATION=+
MFKGLLSGFHGAPGREAGVDSEMPAVGHGDVRCIDVKREFHRLRMGRISLEEFFTTLFELQEVLPQDIVDTITQFLSEKKQMEKMLDILMHAKQEMPTSAAGNVSVRMKYRVPWVISVLIKDGDIKYRNVIAFDSDLIRKYDSFFATVSQSTDPVIISLVTRTLTAVFKEHASKVIDVVCKRNASYKFAAKMALSIHVYYIARLLPNFLRVRDPSSRKLFHYRPASKKGFIHLHNCQIYDILLQQFESAVKLLYGVSDSGQEKNGLAVSDTCEDLKELARANAAQEADRLTNSVFAVQEIAIRAVLTEKPDYGEFVSDATSISALFGKAHDYLNVFQHPDSLMRMLRVAIRVVKLHPDQLLPLQSVLECIRTLYSLFDDPPDLEPFEASVSIKRQSKDKLEAMMLDLLPDLMDVLDCDTGKSIILGGKKIAVLGAARFFLIEFFATALRRGGTEICSALVNNGLPHRMVMLFYSHPNNSLLHQSITTVIENCFEECETDEASLLVARSFLDPEIGLISKLFDAVGRKLKGSESHLSKPAYGYVLRIAEAVIDLLDETQGSRDLFEDLLDESTISMVSKLHEILLEEIEAQGKGSISKVQTYMVRQKQGEAIKAPLEDDGDRLYYMQVIAEQTRAAETSNPRVSVFEFLGLSDNSEESESVSQPRTSVESRPGHARKKSDSDIVVESTRLKPMTNSEAQDRELAIEMIDQPGTISRKKPGRIGLPTSISLDGALNIVGLQEPQTKAKKLPKLPWS